MAAGAGGKTQAGWGRRVRGGGAERMGGGERRQAGAGRCACSCAARGQTASACISSVAGDVGRTGSASMRACSRPRRISASKSRAPTRAARPLNTRGLLASRAPRRDRPTRAFHLRRVGRWWVVGGDDQCTKLAPAVGSGDQCTGWAPVVEVATSVWVREYPTCSILQLAGS